MNEIKVFAPATVANVGCGYDTMGFALDAIGEEIFLKKRNDSRLVIKGIIGAELSTDPETNVATIAIRSFLKSLDSNQGFDLVINKQIKPGSGLGSSASSAAGAVFAANELLGRPYAKRQLLPFALEGEMFASKSKHADNVAPSLLGGFQVIRSYNPLDFFEVKTNLDVKVLIFFPDVNVNTAESKQLLPKEVPISIARDQWANTAALVHALNTGDLELLNKSINDCIAEPVRKKFIPNYEEVKSIVKSAGSVGFNISGSGPSMFALFDARKEVESVIDKVFDVYDSLDGFSIFNAQIDFQGCRTL